LKIGILSDTHSKTTLAKKTIRHLIDEGADFIINEGDVSERKT
jgi:predicted phosphodiesterase